MSWSVIVSVAAVLMTTAGQNSAAALPGSRVAPEPEEQPKSITLRGTAVLLSEVLKPAGLAFDAEPVARQVVLKGDDGTITPLLSDDASRALFLDERLRHRRAEITGRRHPGLPYLQVMSFRVEDQGRLRTPEYFCEICTISVRFPQICPCCQGPMVLRMRPDPG
jgi:hypothetical protein